MGTGAPAEARRSEVAALSVLKLLGSDAIHNASEHALSLEDSRPSWFARYTAASTAAPRKSSATSSPNGSSAYRATDEADTTWITLL
jgi:hypothetical protein